ncbi:MAG: hypothetical protein KME26_14020 [Oscillatoria princeps RMCB-10]|nr:hypothetical protein [Oscillatoria princeps RMCB-10]
MLEQARYYSIQVAGLCDPEDRRDACTAPLLSLRRRFSCAHQQTGFPKETRFLAVVLRSKSVRINYVCRLTYRVS